VLKNIKISQMKEEPEVVHAGKAETGKPAELVTISTKKSSFVSGHRFSDAESG